MKLSAPIFLLKRQARAVSREEGIALSKALDRIARAEGFSSWSLLAARASVTPASSKLLAQLAPGDLVLLGARPGHGGQLRLLAHGLKDDAVARHLGVSVRTARRFIADLHERAGAASRFELGVKAKELGWL